MKRPLVACLVVLALAALAQAQPPDDVIRLTVHPAAAPEPALKYPLLPELEDLLPGNAVVNYHRAVALEGSEHLQLKAEDPLGTWLDLPLRDLPRAEVRRFVEQRRHIYRELEMASRHERCDWQMTERIRTEGFALLLPEVQWMREFANLLQIKARLELAEGHPDQAIRTLGVGFTLARHVNETPTLISSLVANAIVAIMAKELDEFISVPGAPNLYWTLTNLPRPFINLRQALQGEKLMAEALFPGLKEVAANPQAAPLTHEQIEAYIARLSGAIGDHPSVSWRTRTELVLVASQNYDAGKQYLKTRGWTAAQIEALPVLEVIFLYGYFQYQRAVDEMRKWENVPYWEAQPALVKLRQSWSPTAKESDLAMLPMVGQLLPAVDKVYSAQARIERKLAALRCLESCRLYAAAHGGKWPAALDDVKDVPRTIDPVTGKTFEYQVDGDKLTLRAAAPAGEQAGANITLRYELTLKP